MQQGKKIKKGSSFFLATVFLGLFYLESFFALMRCSGVNSGREAKFNSDEVKFGYPKEIGPRGRFYCWGLKHLISRAVSFVWLGEVCGLENLPKKGPFIVVPNHQSYLDFMLIIFALKKVKHVSFFIKQDYFDQPIWNFFLSKMGHVRADKGSLRRSLKLIRKDGQPIVIFAEGQRSKTGEVGRAYPGLGGLASAEPEIPIVPVGINGAFDIWPSSARFPKVRAFKRVKVSIGKPLFFQGERQEFANLVMDRVRELAA